MELGLNLFWLAVSLGAALAWWPWHAGRSNHRRTASRSLLALGCLLALLFPVISVTDDLHAEQMAMEESSRLTLKAQQNTERCLQAARHSTPAAPPVLCPSLGAPRWIVGEVCTTDFQPFLQELRRPSEGRSPPPFYL